MIFETFDQVLLASIFPNINPLGQCKDKCSPKSTSIDQNPLSGLCNRRNPGKILVDQIWCQQGQNQTWYMKFAPDFKTKKVNTVTFDITNPWNNEHVDFANRSPFPFVLLSQKSYKSFLCNEPSVQKLSLLQTVFSLPWTKDTSR